jgi:hypothetical protein
MLRQLDEALKKLNFHLRPFLATSLAEWQRVRRQEGLLRGQMTPNLKTDIKFLIQLTLKF